MLRKDMLSTTSIIDQKMIPSQICLILSGGTTQISLIELPIIFLTIHHKITPTLLIFNTRLQLPTSKLPPQKSNLESLMERFIQMQTKTNEAIDESMSQLNFKFESMSTHQKMMKTQLAQIGQQVSYLSHPQRHVQGQLKMNPKG